MNESNSVKLQNVNLDGKLQAENKRLQSLKTAAASVRAVFHPNPRSHVHRQRDACAGRGPGSRGSHPLWLRPGNRSPGPLQTPWLAVCTTSPPPPWAPACVPRPRWLLPWLCLVAETLSQKKILPTPVTQMKKELVGPALPTCGALGRPSPLEPSDTLWSGTWEAATGSTWSRLGAPILLLPNSVSLSSDETLFLLHFILPIYFLKSQT